MTTPTTVPTAGETPTCDGVCDATGKCDASHPLHCCHLARTVYSGPFAGFACTKGCGKRSRTWTKIYAGGAPAI